MNNYARLLDDSNHPKTGLTIANAVGIVYGQAKSIVLYNGRQVEVSGHASMAPMISDGDQVIAMLTDEGAIVLDRLRRSDEGPSQPFNVNQDGSISLENANGIEISTPDARIMIDEKGTVTVNGKTIKTSAKKENILRGGVIRLN